ncbi:hypothetical protein FHS46_002634 [Variibacter gotjawalensis]|uniref:DUF2855 family protein n=1 Tax=Variibacter gotjawalensis TaxID=1333996 RepID=UPI001E022D58|nr:hypothetical protein [Variibacter gotjawalensis]
MWGFADVVETRHPEIAKGERLYGYFPMATHLVMRAGKVTPGTLNDVSEHRAQLPPAYNRYTRTKGDPAYVAAWEDYDAALRPLFILSFLVDDWLAEEAFFGARQVIITSASSKTALGIAHLLHQRRDIEVVGLTSAGNVDFVEGLRSYTKVVRYDDIASLSPDVPSVLLDIAGNRKLRRSLHEHFGDALKFSSAIGTTHAKEIGDGPMPGPKPVFFFAPDRIRVRYKDWGAEGFAQRFGEAWQGFVGSTEKWMSFVRGKGPEAVEAAYRDIAAGKLKPSEAHMLSLWR